MKRACRIFGLLLALMIAIPVLGSVVVSVNGSNYTIPQTNEKGWGTNVTTWIQAISANALTPIGGQFSLTNDLDFGASFGLKSVVFKSRSLNAAGTGIFRLANTDLIGFRNVGNTADLLFGVGSADGLLSYNGIDLLSTSLTQTLSNKTISGSSNTLLNIPYASLNVTGSILNSDVSTSAAIAYSKLNLASQIKDADISGTAAITRGKLATGTANQVIINDVSGNISSEATLAKSRGGSGQDNTSLTFPSTGAIATTSNTETFSNKTLTSPTISGSTVSDNLALTNVATQTTPSAGITRVYAKSDSNIYKLTSSGVESQIGSGSGGTKNYLGTVNNVNGNGDFELSSTTGWGLGTVGALTNGLPTGTPTFGSGANAGTTFTTVNSGQLGGNYSANFAFSGVSTVGNMVASNAFNLDIGDRARVLSFKFNYLAASGTANTNFSGTSANTYSVAVWDVTNSTWISQSGNFCTTQSSGSAACTGTFQTNSNTASMRFVLYNANATLGAASLYVDDFSVGPQVTAIGAVVTDWVAYPPTFTGFGTPTGVKFYSRRNGDSLEVQGSFTSGTSSTTQAQITLGFNGANGNVTIDSAKQGNLNVVGTGVQTAASATFFDVSVLGTGGLNYLLFGAQTSAASATNPATGSNIVATGNFLGFTAKVPIVGWSSNVQMSSDSSTAVIAATITNSTTQILAANTSTKVVFGSTPTIDTAGAWSSVNNRYTAPVSGNYRITTSLITATSQAFGTNSILTGTIYKNGSSYLGIAWVTGNGTYQFMANGSATIPLNAGDYVEIYGLQNTAGNVTIGQTSYFGVERLSGPAVIAQSESVNARYTNTAGTSVGASAGLIPFATKDFDSHSAFTGTQYNVPVSGKISVTAFLTTVATATSAGQHLNVFLYKNGSQYTTLGSQNYQTINSGYSVGGSDEIPCNAGDYLQIYAASDTATSLYTGAGFSHVSFKRIGN